MGNYQINKINTISKICLKTGHCNLSKLTHLQSISTRIITFLKSSKYHRKFVYLREYSYSKGLFPLDVLGAKKLAGSQAPRLDQAHLIFVASKHTWSARKPVVDMLASQFPVVFPRQVLFAILFFFFFFFITFFQNIFFLC